MVALEKLDIIIIFAAITAGSVVGLEYLRWKEIRLKYKSKSPGYSISQSGAPSEEIEQSNTSGDASEQPSQIDTSPQRHAVTSRNEYGQRYLQRKFLIDPFKLSCDCDEHQPHLYFNWPYSCEVEHRRDDIVVQPGLTPTLVSEIGHQPYEALHLAHRIIEYFSRSEQHMASSQRQAVRNFRVYLPLDILNAEDVRGNDTDMHTQCLTELLNEIFFFNAIKDLDIAWDSNGPDLGNTRTYLKDGKQCTRISLHPTRRFYNKNNRVRQGLSLAEDRLSTIVHELLHAFIQQYACHRCSVDNIQKYGGHGRAWQRIAKAIEEQSLRLLGIEIDMGRLDGMLRDKEEHYAEYSVHDMEAWGLLEL